MCVSSPKTLFVTWQDYQTQLCFPIGRLTFDGEVYTFVYVRGAKQAQQECGFEPLMSFPKWDRVYCSKELFPFFSNRIMRRSRPDYLDYLKRFELSSDTADAMILLERTGGRRQTDSFKIVSCLDESQEQYQPLI